MKKHISIFALLLTVLVGLSASAASDTNGAWYFEDTYGGSFRGGQTPVCLSRKFADGITTFTAIPPAGMKVIDWGWADSSSDAQQHKLIMWNGATTPTYSWPDSEMVKSFVGVVKFGYTTFDVTFNANGGTGKMDPIKGLNIISNFTLTANAFTKTGCHFTGWKTNLTKGVVFKDGASLTGADLWNGTGFNSTFYAQWVPNTYTVHFDGNGATGGSMEDEIFTYDETKVLTANAFERDGFAFAGWATNAVAGAVVYEDKESVRNLTTNDNETVNLYARWTQMHEVTFRDSAMFDGKVLKVEYVVDGKDATPPDVPQHPGLSFKGWEGTYTSVTSDRTITAKYEGTEGVVWYYANDGTDDKTYQDFKHGVETTLLSANTFLRTGYTLNGWMKNAASTAADYACGAKLMIPLETDVFNLYAFWKPISYTVTFDGNGGEGAMEPISLDYGVPFEVPECGFKKTGCEFQSWQVLIGGKAVTNYLAGTTVSNLTSEASGTVIFKAEWLGRYKIAFDANGGEGMMETTNVERDVGFQLPSNAFTRTGYDFTMWTTNLPPSDKSIIADGATVTNLVAAGETCTLYALWNPHHYTIAFDANGGKGEDPADRDCTYGEEVPLPSNPYVPPKNYATFIGWSTNKSDTVGVYTVSNLTAEAGGIVTVYAIWSYDVGEWSRVLDCDNLKFENGGLVPWVALTNDYGGLSPSYAFHKTSVEYRYDGILSAVVDESGTLSFWWKAVNAEDWLTVEYRTLDDADATILFTTNLYWRSDDWVMDSLRIDLPSGMDAMQVQFVHGNPVDIFLDCVTWVPDGGGEPTPGDPVAVTAAGIEGNVFSLTIPAKSAESGTDYGVWTNADLTVDSWGLMGKPQPGERKPLEFKWTILPEFPQLFFRAHKVEYK